MPLPKFKEFQRFPAEIASYRRGQVTAYAPALADYSIAYDRYDSELQNAVTLYFYPMQDDNLTQLRAEEAQILNAHPGGKLISRETIALQSGGVPYEVNLVSFEYGGFFAGRQQQLCSYLLLAYPNGRSFKVRSTAPVAQLADSEKSLLRLLEGVEWAK